MKQMIMIPTTRLIIGINEIISSTKMSENVMSLSLSQFLQNRRTELMR